MLKLLKIKNTKRFDFQIDKQGVIDCGVGYEVRDVPNKVNTFESKMTENTILSGYITSNTLDEGIKLLHTFLDDMIKYKHLYEVGGFDYIEEYVPLK